MEQSVNEKKDIFDKIMDMGFLRKFQPFYKKNKQMLLYLLFGGLTTVVSFIFLGVPQKIFESMGIPEGKAVIPSNIISWICAVTFAFVTNRIWVFDSKAKGLKEIAAEGVSFYAGRVFTLIVETFIMWLGVDLLNFNLWAMKIAASVVVLVLNYIISKLIIFRKK